MPDPWPFWMFIGLGVVTLVIVFWVMRRPGEYDDRDDDDESFWRSINKGR